MGQLNRVAIEAVVGATLLAVAVIFGIGAVALADVRLVPKTGADVASWVQAIGSILAIAGSIYGLRWQLNKTDEREKKASEDRHRERRRSVAMSLHLAHACSESAVKGVSGSSSKEQIQLVYRQFIAVRMRDHIHNLDGLRMDEILDADLMFDALSLRASVKSIDAQLHDLNADQLDDQQLKDCQKRLTTELDVLNAHWRAFVKKTPIDWTAGSYEFHIN